VETKPKRGKATVSDRRQAALSLPASAGRKNKAAPASLIWPPMASVGSSGSDEYLDPAKSDHGLEAAIATR
jgi:hypothetical protein